MGEAQRRKVKIKTSAPCIFCGGGTLATTKEHCPPKALFRNKEWPDGYVFPACINCNGGSSDEDLIVAFLAHLKTEDPQKTKKGLGLMKAVHRQFPDFLHRMFNKTARESRNDARKLGIKPEPGETYQELGIANVTEAMHKSVSVLAAKLTKAVYYMQTNSIFPTDGGIMFQWFTNAQKLEHGKVILLEAAAKFSAISPPKQRNGKDLKDQFDYRYSVGEKGELHLLQVVFGETFGFLTIFSQTPGRLESMEDSIKRKLSTSDSPFKFLSTNRELT